MKRFAHPLPARARLWSVLAFALLAVPLAARIGERQGQIEDRLLADGTAQRLQPSEAQDLEAAIRLPPANSTTTSTTTPGGRRGGRGGRGFGGGGFGPGGQGDNGGGGGSFDVAVIDKVLWEAIGQSMPDPDSRGVRKRPPDFPEYIYFKTDDGSKAAPKIQNPAGITGWELKVYLYKQYSGLEVYHRLGTDLTDAEVAAILNANRGDTNWNRGSGTTSADDSNASFIGFQYERADGQVRATRVGNDLVLFSTDLDRSLVKVREAVAKAALDAANAGGTNGSGNTTRGF